MLEFLSRDYKAIYYNFNASSLCILLLDYGFTLAESGNLLWESVLTDLHF